MPGKVNLTLEILGRREDGYHELRSVVMPVALCETVSVQTRTDGKITLETVGEGIDFSGLADLPMEKQLAVKAVRAFGSATGKSDLGFDIRVVKRIPIGGGMAGGSADAAGVLACLRTLCAPEMSDEELRAIAAPVGSDVPALLCGGTALMEGRGDRVRPLPVGSAEAPHLVVACPGFSVSTKDVYAACDAGNPAWLRRDGATEACRAALEAGDVKALAASLFNGLQGVVDTLHPVTMELREALLGAGAAGALLSGSGSSVFGLAENEEQARMIASRLMGDCRVLVLRMLPRGV